MRAMTERARVLVLILIMTMGLLLVTGITIGILYSAAFDEEKARLTETAQGQARLIEAVARYDTVHSTEFPGGSDAATLQQVVDAHREYRGFGETGEFTLARKEGALIVFILEHRHTQVQQPEPIPFDSNLAEPMRRALSGQSGTVVGLDYRGATVLAAFEPVKVLDLGIVAKIDLVEVQEPFWRAGLFAVGFSLFVAVAGAILLVRISNPLIAELEDRSHQLERSVAALSVSEKQFRTTFELAGVGIAQVSLDGRISDVNPRLCEITGYSDEDFKGLALQEITHPDDLDTDLEYARQLIAGEIDRYSRDKRYFRKDTSEIWVHLTVSLVRDDDGNPEHFVAVVEDMTARRAVEAVIKGSLDEKEVLLREIHHRVKNNMQVISSLLSLQSKKIDDARLKELFQESQEKVRAMALVHEILYDSVDLSRIDLKEYISRLATGLKRMYGAEAGPVQLNVESEGISLGIDAMLPCGLAISELISNSMKYAFPDGRGGKIHLGATLTTEGAINLVMRDNGVGIPTDLDIRNANSMGLGLIHDLIEKQLGGQLDLDRTRGTCFTIVIPKESVNP